MRKDIELHIQTGDIVLAPTNKYVLRDFRWILTDGFFYAFPITFFGEGESDKNIVVDQEGDLERYIYAEIEVPYSLSVNTIRKNGLYVSIPYTPIYKELKIRVRRTEEGEVTYLQNDATQSCWFTVKAAMCGKELSNVFISTLPAISETSFHIMFKDGYAQIYSCDQSDFNIVKANRQNANCLLACVPGCNYQYPLTGVGLVRWINSTNVLSSGLSDILISEFMDDGVVINDAAYNYDTKQMELNLDVVGE